MTTDRQKARRFVRSLSTHMQRIFASNPDLTFAQAMDRARYLEELDERLGGGVTGSPIRGLGLSHRLHDLVVLWCLSPREEGPFRGSCR